METKAIIMGDTDRDKRDPRYPYGINLLGKIPTGQTFGNYMVSTLKQVSSIESIIVVTDTGYLSYADLGLEENIDTLLDGGLDFARNLKKVSNHIGNADRLFIFPGDMPHMLSSEIESALLESEKQSKEILFLISTYDSYLSISGCWHDSYGARLTEDATPMNYMKYDSVIIYPNDRLKNSSIFERYVSMHNVRNAEHVWSSIRNIFKHAGYLFPKLYMTIPPSVYQIFQRQKLIENPHLNPEPPKNAPLVNYVEAAFSAVLGCKVGILVGNYCSFMDPDRPDQFDKMIGQYDKVHKRLLTYK